jgi:hypothetical protein
MHSTGKLIKIILLMQYFNTSGTIFAFDYVIKQMFIREKITLLEMNDNLSWSWQCIFFFFLQNHYKIMNLISHPNIQTENKSKSAYHKHCILIRTLLNLLHFSIHTDKQVHFLRTPWRIFLTSWHRYIYEQLHHNTQLLFHMWNIRFIPPRNIPAFHPYLYNKIWYDRQNRNKHLLSLSSYFDIK